MAGMVIRIEKKDVADAAQTGEYPVLILDKMVFELDILILSWSRTTNSKNIRETILANFGKQVANEVYNYVRCIYNQTNLLAISSELYCDEELKFFGREFQDTLINLITYKNKNSLITKVEYNGTSIR